MKWSGRRESDNVDDQRGGGGGFGGLPVKGGLGLVVVVIIVSLITGRNPLALLQSVSTDDQTVSAQTYEPTPEEEQLTHFVKVILASTEDVWHDLMKDYRDPHLVLFSGQTQSGCGAADAATGPFYCSEDEKVYIDLSFYQQLKDQFQAPGEFAEAYVIAHEVGHHVQHLLGIIDKVHQMQSQMSEVEANKLSVRLELQADFLAGVWAHHTKEMTDMIEAGDFESAINAATAIGDDRLQKQFQGRVTPDSFTHGTSAQRVKWFTRGFKTGDTSQGDTFNVSEDEL